MGYEDATATKIMATNCACCGRPLVDAKSVETGMGPICRKKYGYGVDVSEDARKRANAIIYALAVAVSTDSVTLESMESVSELRALGFPLIADIFLFNGASISVEVREHEGEDRYFVRAPYDPDFNHDSWFKGRFGVKCPATLTPSKKKVFHWTFPKTQAARERIWAALVKHHAGRMAIGPNGPFVVAPLKTAAQKKAEAEQSEVAAQSEAEAEAANVPAPATHSGKYGKCWCGQPATTRWMDGTPYCDECYEGRCDGEQMASLAGDDA